MCILSDLQSKRVEETIFCFFEVESFLKICCER